MFFMFIQISRLQLAFEGNQVTFQIHRDFLRKGINFFENSGPSKFD